jgi:hypothetical protein
MSTFKGKKQVALRARIDQLSLEDQGRVDEFVKTMHQPYPMVIAGRIADRFIGLHLSDLQGVLDPNNEANDPDGKNNHALFEDIRAVLDTENAGNKLARLENRISAALPKALKAQLTQLIDGIGREESFRTEAAYLVGMAVGRRLAGGAR